MRASFSSGWTRGQRCGGESESGEARAPGVERGESGEGRQVERPCLPVSSRSCLRYARVRSASCEVESNARLTSREFRPMRRAFQLFQLDRQAKARRPKDAHANNGGAPSLTRAC
eukprot:3641739-Pleurochrysis_carterae.AAC.1